MMVRYFCCDVLFCWKVVELVEVECGGGGYWFKVVLGRVIGCVVCFE